MRERVSAILLAAGRSRRMGQPKELLPINDRPAVLCTVETLISAGLRDIVVVLGPSGEAVRGVLAGLPIRFAVNEQPESEMAESVRLGLSAVDREATGVLVCLADHPTVETATVERLIAARELDPEAILIPRYAGRRGHPTLFPRPIIEEVFGGSHLRLILDRHPGRLALIDVDDEGVITDLDTPEDYRRVVGRLSS